jgi:hypothetical protein
MPRPTRRWFTECDDLVRAVTSDDLPTVCRLLVEGVSD